MIQIWICNWTSYLKQVNQNNKSNILSFPTTVNPAKIEVHTPRQTRILSDLCDLTEKETMSPQTLLNSEKTSSNYLTGLMHCLPKLGNKQSETSHSSSMILLPDTKWTCFWSEICNISWQTCLKPKPSNANLPKKNLMAEFVMMQRKVILTVLRFLNSTTQFHFLLRKNQTENYVCIWIRRNSTASVRMMIPRIIT